MQKFPYNPALYWDRQSCSWELYISEEEHAYLVISYKIELHNGAEDERSPRRTQLMCKQTFITEHSRMIYSLQDIQPWAHFHYLCCWLNSAAVGLCCIPCGLYAISMVLLLYLYLITIVWRTHSFLPTLWKVEEGVACGTNKAKGTERHINIIKQEGNC